MKIFLVSTLIGAVFLLAAPAQSQTSYIEAVKPENLGELATTPNGIYNSIDEAFAAYKDNFETGPCSELNICTAWDFHPCANNSKYLWGQGHQWCWREKVVRKSNGAIVADRVVGYIWLYPICPSKPSYSYRYVHISGGGTPNNPNYYEDRCERTVPATIQCGKDEGLGNPIYPANCTKRQTDRDYTSGAGNLAFTRDYNSDFGRFRHAYDVHFTAPGQKVGSTRIAGEKTIGGQVFRRGFQVLNTTAAGAAAVYTGPDGARNELTWDGTTGLSTAAHFKNRLLRLPVDGVDTWLLIRPDERRILGFDDGGRLKFRQSPNGQRVTSTYLDGQLSSLSDNWGHRLQISHDANGVSAVVDPAGHAITYSYADPNKLSEVTYPDGSSRSYVWDEAAWSTGTSPPPNRLTGIIDEAMNRYASFGYAAGKAVSTEHAGGVERYSIADSRPTNSVGNLSVTDPLGTVRTTYYSRVSGLLRPTQITQPAVTSGTVTRTIAYDTTGNVTSRTDFRGGRTCYQNDVTRNLETVRLDGLASGVSCPSNLATYVVPANSRQRKISTQSHSQWSIPVSIAGPRKRSSWVFNGMPDPTAGGAVAQCAPSTATLADGSPIAVVCKYIEEGTGDETGTQGFSAPLTGEARTWTYTYNSFGQALTADGPRTDVSDITTYTYYNCTTGYHCGHVDTITNAAGHVTTYNTYNAHGQPLTITDPNDVVTTLTYDLRQRLTSRTVGSEQTTFAYWPTGLLKKVTLPDASFLEYTYDAAHRLTEIADSEGNRIVYTLDNMGNRTAEQIFDPSSALTQTRTRVFNALNRLWQELGAASTTNVTTMYGYDNNGNETSVAAPLSRNTGQAYDELNRLTQVTDPLLGSTHYGYNALDQLISVTDPRSKVTSYTYNSLGDLTEQVSPDTGTTVNTYDAAGNLLTSTDARNKTATYSYDALNRVSSLSYPDQTISYTHDSGTNQKGRLTQINDASGSTSWTYDAQGRVLSRHQSMGIVKSLAYSYDSSGRLQTLTLPSGNTVSYGYMDGKLLSLTLNGSTTILSNVLYQPFGPTRGWTWGNNTQAVREYDTDGLITDLDSAGLKTYSYDDAFRITGIADANDPGHSQSYGYDLLDRLTSATGTGLNQGWTYDANGNRLTETGHESSAYEIASSSNRLMAASGALSRTYVYDAAGNVTSDGTATYAYSDAGRMVSATKSGVTTSFKLNGLGQRVKKTASSATTYFVYDEAGHLVGEYDSTGALIQETLWLSDIPVAVLKANGNVVSLYYLHTDHLNTPRRITRPSDNTVIWHWLSNPFGTTQADEDPDGDSGTFSYGLRFPGQYFDSETGIHYNYYRDYDPSTGRYVQSDPIGLDGGTNTFAYVGSNPLQYTDPLGWHKGDKWYGFTNRDFQRWFHRCWKQAGDPDADKQVMAEAYAEWLSRGSPTGDKCDNRPPPPPPAPAAGVCGESCKEEAVTVVTAAGAAYVVYRCARMVPSLFPPLWPTIPANVVIP